MRLERFSLRIALWIGLFCFLASMDAFCLDSFLADHFVVLQDGHNALFACVEDADGTTRLKQITQTEIAKRDEPEYIHGISWRFILTGPQTGRALSIFDCAERARRDKISFNFDISQPLVVTENGLIYFDAVGSDLEPTKKESYRLKFLRLDSLIAAEARRNVDGAQIASIGLPEIPSRWGWPWDFYRISYAEGTRRIYFPATKGVIGYHDTATGQNVLTDAKGFDPLISPSGRYLWYDSGDRMIMLDGAGQEIKQLPEDIYDGTWALDCDALLYLGDDPTAINRGDLEWVHVPHVLKVLDVATLAVNRLVAIPHGAYRIYALPIGCDVANYLRSAGK